MSKTDTLDTHAKTWVLKNAVATVSALSLVIAGMKLLAVSGGDTQVLRTLVQTLDIPTLVTATLLPLMPNVIIVAYLMYWDGQLAKSKKNRAHHPEWALLIVNALVVSLALLVPLILLSSYILFFVFIQHKRYAARRRGLGLTNVSYPMTLIPWLILVIISGTSIWLPIENITLDSGDQKSAYVLTTDIRWTTLLIEEESVAVLPTPTIKAREICSNLDRTDFFTASAASLIGTVRSELPECARPQSDDSVSLDKEKSMGNNATTWSIIALTISCAGLAVSCFAWTRAGTTDERDKRAWRLTRLQQDVVSLLQLSKARNELCKTAGDSYKGIQTAEMQDQYEKIAALDQQIKTANDGEITKYAHTIEQLHLLSAQAYKNISQKYIETEKGNKIQTLGNGTLKHYQAQATIDQHSLEMMHAALTMATRNELGLKHNSQNLLPDAPKTESESVAEETVSARGDQ